MKAINLTYLARGSRRFAAGLVIASLSAVPAVSQTPVEEPAQSGVLEADDEVISYGTMITGQHEGMDAFFRGDFEMAEIEFEREFISLKRFESSKENAAVDAELAVDRAASLGAASGNESAAFRGPGGGFAGGGAEALVTNPGVRSNFRRQREEGRTLLTDGKVTYEDFGFVRYMSGLSEIKQGKYAEAERSLKQSLRYTKDNYDARMRLGLLMVKKEDFDAAADQLEALEKMRQSCAKRTCRDLEEITSSAMTLAEQLTAAIP